MRQSRAREFRIKVENKDLSRLKIDKSGTTPYRGAKRNRLFRILAYTLICLLGFIICRIVFFSSLEVRVATVTWTYPSQAVTLLNASGYAVAQRKASVAAKITGRLEWLGVEEGNRVKKGQTIAKLESEDASAARDQAAANLDNAVSALEVAKAELDDALLHYNRQKALLFEKIVPQSEFDVAGARYKKALASVTAAESAIDAGKAALRVATVTMRYCFIRAPFDAVVLTKNADVGDIITPMGASANAKAAVVTIADLSSILVEADVSESNLQKVAVGQPCEIQLDALPDARFRGMVHTIVPTADRSKASVMVKIKFLDSDERILPEMSAKVAFLEKPLSVEECRPKIALNKNAIITRNGASYVFLVKEGHAIETPVATGVQMDDMVEVVAGVKPGDTIAINPPKGMKNGARVKNNEKE